MKPLRNNPRSSIPCPRCNKLVSRKADACIHCGLPRPGRYADIPVLGELITGAIAFVDPVVIVCFVLFVLAIALDISGTSLSGNIFSMLSPSGESLLKLGMGGLYPLQMGRWWSLVTGTYLHGSILHIGFNMLWLRQIGPWVEELFGKSRFWVIYTISGLAGAILTTVFGTPFFVGASGAVFGLFGALIYYGWRRGGTFGSGLFRQVLIWAGFGLVFGFIMPNVDNWGHLGGLAAGAIMALLLGYEERNRETLIHHVLATVCLVGVVICFGFMFISFFS
jgi:rhomboid protease GluP